MSTRRHCFLVSEVRAFAEAIAGVEDVIMETQPGETTERPVPQPQKNEVLIKVAAAGVNGPDIMQRKGLYPAPPGATDRPVLYSRLVVPAGSRWRLPIS